MYSFQLTTANFKSIFGDGNAATASGPGNNKLIPDNLANKVNFKAAVAKILDGGGKDGLSFEQVRPYIDSVWENETIITNAQRDTLMTKLASNGASGYTVYLDASTSGLLCVFKE